MMYPSSGKINRANKEFEQSSETLVSAKDIIEYIEERAEIAIPIEEIFNDDLTDIITQEEYRKILIKHLCIELKEKFVK